MTITTKQTMTIDELDVLSGPEFRNEYDINHACTDDEVRFVIDAHDWLTVCRVEGFDGWCGEWTQRRYDGGEFSVEAFELDTPEACLAELCTLMAEKQGTDVVRPVEEELPTDADPSVFEQVNAGKSDDLSYEGFDVPLMDALRTMEEKGEVILGMVLADRSFTPSNALLQNVCLDSELMAVIAALVTRGAVTRGQLYDLAESGVRSLRARNT